MIQQELRLQFHQTAGALISGIFLMGCGPSEVFYASDDDGMMSLDIEEIRESQVRSPSGEFLLETDHCSPDSSGKYSDDTQMTVSEPMVVAMKSSRGKSSSKTVYFAKGGGCVLRPLRELWAVALHWDDMQWKDSGSATVEGITPLRKGAVQSFRVNYHQVPIPFVNVDWALDWNFYLPWGTPQNPESLMIHFFKSSGTDYITYWEGRIQLHALSSNVTSFTLDASLLAYTKDQKAVDDEVYEYHQKLKSVSPNWSALP